MAHRPRTAALIFEPGSAARNVTAGWRSSRPVVDLANCVGCLVCWIYCPEPAIIVTEDGKVAIDYDHCKGCGICAVECPRRAIRMVRES